MPFLVLIATVERLKNTRAVLLRAVSKDTEKTARVTHPSSVFLMGHATKP